MPDIDNVLAHIAAHQHDAVAQLRTLLRHRSISASSIFIMLAIPHPAVQSGFGIPDKSLYAMNENMPIDRYMQGSLTRPASWTNTPGNP
jgi:hypothetical protein